MWYVIDMSPSYIVLRMLVIRFTSEPAIEVSSSEEDDIQAPPRLSRQNDDDEIGTSLSTLSSPQFDISECVTFIARLRTRWKAPVYGFFKLDSVTVGYDHGTNRKYHYFPCTLGNTCKSTARGVKRYQDTGDKSSTQNLTSHAEKCHGKQAVSDAKVGRISEAQDGSIHAAFARQGQQPVKATFRSFSSRETRYGSRFYSLLSSLI